MLNPGPADLLAGVAEALKTTVLPELADGPARDQMTAAIAIIAKAARALPGFPTYLHEDIADLATTLPQLGAPLNCSPLLGRSRRRRRPSTTWPVSTWRCAAGWPTEREPRFRTPNGARWWHCWHD